MGSHLDVRVHTDPKLAPRYAITTTSLECREVVITEKGTEGDLPIVDFVMYDSIGNQYFMSMTGRLVNGISSVIKGTNMRNHGNPEP